MHEKYRIWKTNVTPWDVLTAENTVQKALSHSFSLLHSILKEWN
jgi:hypothetical protein